MGLERELEEMLSVERFEPSAEFRERARWSDPKVYEEAAADLGAPRRDQFFRVLLPLLAPAIVASAAVAFATSIDDFVVTQYLSSDASTTTVSMLLYSSARGAPTPALNAIATVNLMITLLTLALAFFVYRRFASRDEATTLATMEV